MDIRQRIIFYGFCFGLVLIYIDPLGITWA